MMTRTTLTTGGNEQRVIIETDELTWTEVLRANIIPMMLATYPYLTPNLIVERLMEMYGVGNEPSSD